MSLRIDFTDRHESHPSSVKEYAIEKVGRLERYFNGVQHIEIILDQEHGQHSAEVLVSAPQNQHFVGHCSDDSVMVAVDRVVEKLEKQVKRYKERLKDHRKGDPGNNGP